uniref:Uncharacterized protein n=1 Tax=Arundo donax TaxID=35708 RepID=A0A0A8YT22_ARUDO
MIGRTCAGRGTRSHVPVRSRAVISSAIACCPS